MFLLEIHVKIIRHQSMETRPSLYLTFPLTNNVSIGNTCENHWEMAANCIPATTRNQLSRDMTTTTAGNEIWCNMQYLKPIACPPPHHLHDNAFFGWRRCAACCGLFVCWIDQGGRWEWMSRVWSRGDGEAVDINTGMTATSAQS